MYGLVGCCNEVPQTFVLSQFWGSEVKKQDVSRTGSFWRPRRQSAPRRSPSPGDSWQSLVLPGLSPPHAISSVLILLLLLLLSLYVVLLVCACLSPDFPPCKHCNILLFFLVLSMPNVGLKLITQGSRGRACSPDRASPVASDSPCFMRIPVILA